MAITWKNMVAPDFTTTGQLLNSAGNSFESALKGLNDMVTDYQTMQQNSEKKVIDRNTQLAREAIANLKTIEDYQNTTFEDIIGKYGEMINRDEIFTAYDQRDEDIYKEQDALKERALKEDILQTTNTIDSMMAEMLANPKNTQEQVRQMVEAAINGKPTAVKSAVRKHMQEIFTYDLALTPEDKMIYDAHTAALDMTYQIKQQDLLDTVADNEAIIARDPLKDTTELRSQLSLADYVNQHAPDSFEMSLPGFLGGKKYEGDDIIDLLDDTKNDERLLGGGR